MAADIARYAVCRSSWDVAGSRESEIALGEAGLLRAGKANIKWKRQRAAPLASRVRSRSPTMAGVNRDERVSVNGEVVAAEYDQMKKSEQLMHYNNRGLTMVKKSHPAYEAALEVMRDVVTFVKREVYVSYRFVSYDLTVTVLPGTLLTLVTHLKGATLFGGVAVARVPFWQSLPNSFLWMWLFVYVITLANQTHGGAEGGEDALNKPTRPIPSGVVTVDGGYRRLVWVCLLFTLLGARLRIGMLSALWVANVITLECWGPSCTYLHWLVKPIAMMIGIFIICVGNPSLVAPIAHHRPTLFYMTAISLAMGLLGSSIQDIRDVEGDRRKGNRLSLPILLGEVPARYLCNFLLLCSWGTLHTALMALPGPYNLVTSMAILLWCLFLCCRTLVLRSAAQDHKTYLAFVYLYSFLLLSYSWVV